MTTKAFGYYQVQNLNLSFAEIFKEIEVYDAKFYMNKPGIIIDA